ncbi:MAG TPA: ECF transporter S component [Firmicutes bacterium]|nr:ECF transporter S component [Bacillota bacterium]
MKKSSTKHLVLAGLFVGLGLLMPFLTGQIPSVGSRLLPMHIPVLLGGFVLGGSFGLVIGLVTPLLRSVLFGMPPLFPTAFVMSCELAAYGYLAGAFYRFWPKKSDFVYLSLLAAMVGGRIVWGLVSVLVYGLSSTPFTWQMFMAGSVVNALPGIALQILVIPIIVLALKRAKLMA